MESHMMIHFPVVIVGQITKAIYFCYYTITQLTIVLPAILHRNKLYYDTAKFDSEKIQQGQFAICKKNYPTSLYRKPEHSKTLPKTIAGSFFLFTTSQIEFPLIRNLAQATLYIYISDHCLQRISLYIKQHTKSIENKLFKFLLRWTIRW